MPIATITIGLLIPAAALLAAALLVLLKPLLVRYALARPNAARSSLGERFAQIVVAALATTLFLGAFTVPYLSQADILGWLSRSWSPITASLACAAIHVAAFCAKTAAMLFVQQLVRPYLIDG